MVRLFLAGRVLVAGMPGAGKSTLLRSLPTSAEVAILDSDVHRAAIGAVLPRWPYAAYRPLVHLRHRLSMLVAASTSTPVLVVHLPATTC